MVKNKRNKKDVPGDDENNSDVDTAQTQVAAGSDDEGSNIKKSAAKSKTKKAAGKVKAAAIVDKSDDDDDVDDSVPVVKSKKKGKKAGGFALLQVEDEDNDMLGQSQSDNDDDGEKRAPAKKPVAAKPMQIHPEKQQQQQGKKGKKNKRKDQEDEEDIEKLLAELEIEYAGGKPAGQTAAGGAGGEDDDDEKKKKAPAKGSTGRTHKKSVSHEIDEMLDDDYGADMDLDMDSSMPSGGMKTAAQKKKEKKERQRLEKLAAKESGVEVKKAEPAPAKKEVKKEETPAPEEPVAEVEPVAAEGEDGDDKKSKKKKGKKGEKTAAEEEKAANEKGGKKGPNKALVAAMQERLKAMKEEEERLQREEEERIRILEEADALHREQLRLEAEKKEKKKQKEKERKERLKAEGKLLTKKQQADRARAQAMLESLKAQGVEVPEPGKKSVRPGTRIRPKKEKTEETTPPVEEKPVEEVKPEVKVEEKPKDAVKDSWDASSSEDEEEQAGAKEEAKKETPVSKEESDEEEDESDSDDEEDSESETESDAFDDTRTDAEKKRDKAKQRIEKRREEAIKNRSPDHLRAPVVCVLGHVDTGKTKILDKLRRTNVQDGEAGGITQQIGATNVPIDAIKEQCKIVKNGLEFIYKVPGLLIIDTPGHESFSNLRNRGSSLCDIAILVVDIMHGLEPQTIESINLLKQKKTPFLVALNKIDRLYDWVTMPRKDVRDTLKAQQQNTQLEFKQRTDEVISQFAMQGLNAKLFYENPDVTEYISLVPTSAITGEGMGNLLYLICEYSQTMLTKRLMYSEELQATVLEVKAIPGLGTTIDAILINGRLREGETMILAGTEGPITTQIRSLLMPQPMKELRVKNAYIEHKEVQAAQGVKIAAKDLEKAIAGLNLLVAQKPDEVELMREEVARDLKSALSSIKLTERGVFVQASTLGSLEALLEFLKVSKIPYAGIRIGPVVKRDVMKASTMLEHDKKYATILAFDVKVEKDAQELADTLHVKIFQADIIYHLFDKFMAYQDELKQKKRDEFKSIAVFPCKLKVLPQHIFKSRDPIVMGVMVENGIVKVGTPICVPSKNFVYLGIVTSIECNHKQVESARKGQEVCVKIENVPGETPKLYGRHFDETDMLVSKISRQSIDACKEYFRDDLIKADWTLMVELKKLFEIL